MKYESVIEKLSQKEIVKLDDDFIIEYIGKSENSNLIFRVTKKGKINKVMKKFFIYTDAFEKIDKSQFIKELNYAMNQISEAYNKLLVKEN